MRQTARRCSWLRGQLQANSEVSKVIYLLGEICEWASKSDFSRTRAANTKRAFSSCSLNAGDVPEAMESLKIGFGFIPGQDDCGTPSWKIRRRVDRLPPAFREQRPVRFRYRATVSKSQVSEGTRLSRLRLGAGSGAGNRVAGPHDRKAATMALAGTLQTI
jgi:hypothetical protein